MLASERGSLFGSKSIPLNWRVTLCVNAADSFVRPLTFITRFTNILHARKHIVINRRVAIVVIHYTSHVHMHFLRIRNLSLDGQATQGIVILII